ncbi:MAG: hypothetical protein ACXAB7_00555 [Candidatus Kariarchaeaceae archaeon]|jgi:metal-responsive CopG/Arc/MetJ family transcriptional regulator
MSTRDSRITIRISKEFSKQIDAVVAQNKDIIKSRADFGFNALQMYMDQLRQKTIQKDLSLAVLSLAHELGSEREEIDRLREHFIADIPLDYHPKYVPLIELKNQLAEGVQKKMDKLLDSASYADLEDVYEKVLEQFLKQG